MQDILILIESKDTPELRHFTFGIRESFASTGIERCRFELRDPGEPSRDLKALFAGFVDRAQCAREDIADRKFLYTAPKQIALCEGNEDFWLTFAMISFFSERRMIDLDLDACCNYPTPFERSVILLAAGAARERPATEATPQELNEARRLITTTQAGFATGFRSIEKKSVVVQRVN